MGASTRQPGSTAIVGRTGPRFSVAEARAPTSRLFSSSASTCLEPAAHGADRRQQREVHVAAQLHRAIGQAEPLLPHGHAPPRGPGIGRGLPRDHRDIASTGRTDHRDRSAIGIGASSSSSSVTGLRLRRLAIEVVERRLDRHTRAPETDGIGLLGRRVGLVLGGIHRGIHRGIRRRIRGQCEGGCEPQHADFWSARAHRNG